LSVPAAKIGPVGITYLMNALKKNTVSGNYIFDECIKKKYS